MNIKLIIILSIFCLSPKDQAFSQNIKIWYHVGSDCNPEINGEIIRGGCVTNERMEYRPKKGGKYIISSKLKIEKDIREYKNGEFGKNLVEDSLKIFRLSRKIASKKLIRLVNYLKLVECKFENKIDTIEYRQNKIISKWDKNTFELSQREILKIKKKAKEGKGDLSTDSLIQIVNNYLKGENEGFLVSSVTEFLNISFEYEKKKYSILQNNLGGVNLSWQIEIDDKRYHVISPELNKMISPFLAKEMRAKKAIIQFLKIEELERAFVN